MKWKHYARIEHFQLLLLLFCQFLSNKSKKYSEQCESQWKKIICTVFSVWRKQLALCGNSKINLKLETNISLFQNRGWEQKGTASTTDKCMNVAIGGKYCFYISIKQISLRSIRGLDPVYVGVYLNAGNVKLYWITHCAFLTDLV